MVILGDYEGEGQPVRQEPRALEERLQRKDAAALLWRVSAGRVLWRFGQNHF